MMAASHSRRALRVMPLLSLSALLLALGCEARHSDAGHTVVDSAGIRIVTSPRPVWEHDGWRVSDEPLLDVGAHEGDDAYLFNRLSGLVRLGDGGIVVANGGDNSIRRFDRSGTLVWKAGGTGGGPEEYAAIGKVKLLGDTILALDESETQPNHLYDLDGKQIGTVGRYERVPGRPISVYDVFPDGSYLYASFPQGVPPRGDRWVDSASMFRVSADLSRTDSLLRLPAVEFAHFNARMGYPVVFGPIFTGAVADGEFYADFPDDCDIGVYDFSGNEVRHIRWACAVRSIPADVIERYKQQYVNGPGEQGGPLPPELRARREAMLAQQQFAERYPAHGMMKVDGAGNLWVQRAVAYGTGVSVEPLVWDVFDAQGVWQGPVSTPPRLSVREIGADYVAGVWRDADDIEHARVYALIKE